ncbi:MAG: class I SAM-dependent methyltransferase [Chloroflexi bacterium]|nr:class I SAM-dependent methyltransferase [Chloroflexota bacterium]
MPDNSGPDRFNDFLLSLHGTDPFAEVADASEAHRIEHASSLAGGEQECGAFPSSALKMRLLAAIGRATNARRVLEIGGGLGYSAIWFADIVGDGGRVETIDRFTEHVDMIRRYAERFGMGDRITALAGEADDVLPTLDGAYDIVHDDGWFGAQPSYYDRLAGLLRPGGLLVMSNWFLLEHAVTGQSPVDWSQVLGPSWAEDIKSYARRLATDERYQVSFVQRPAVALAYRRPDA